MSTETSCHFGHFQQVSKKSLRSLILYNYFMILYMYIHVAPGQGLTTPLGQNFDVNRNILSLWSFVASLKKNLFEVWFYTFFFFFFFDIIHVYAHRQPPGDKVLMPTEMSCHFIHLLQVLKKMSLSLILYHFFHGGSNHMSHTRYMHYKSSNSPHRYNTYIAI